MKNKKVYILGIIVFIIIVIITIGIIVSNTISKKNINENFEIANIINNNSYLPIQYMSKYNKTDTKFQEYQKIDNYMSIDFNNNDISFSYYGYPNDQSEKYLGEISILTNQYNILGITIGDDIESSITKLQNYGFKLEKTDANSLVILNYKDYTIELETDITNNSNAVIKTLHLKINSKYLGNLVY